MYYVPQAKFYHKVARTYDKYDPKMLYHMYSGKVLFMKKHLSRVQWRLWRVGFFCYLLGFGIPKLTVMAYRANGQWKLGAIARSCLRAYREHATA